jgi:4-methyl-5(b-hydroxyethyl)-thiazole monophosphate biosynthesis
MVYIFLGDGFEEIEAVAVGDILRRGGVETAFAGIGSRTITGSHGLCVTADCTVTDICLDTAEMIVIPGGLGGVESIESSTEAMSLIKRAYVRGIETAAICAGPRVLAKLGILEGKTAVCYPGMEDAMTGSEIIRDVDIARSGTVTTGRGPGVALHFGLKLLEVLRGQKTADTVAAGMLV